MPTGVTVIPEGRTCHSYFNVALINIVYQSFHLILPLRKRHDSRK